MTIRIDACVLPILYVGLGQYFLYKYLHNDAEAKVLVSISDIDNEWFREPMKKHVFALRRSLVLMMQPQAPQPERVPRGIALAEYGILLGLVSLLAVAGLTMLGDASFNLVAQTGNILSDMGFGQKLALRGNANAGGLASTILGGAAGSGSTSTSTLHLTGSGYYQMVIDPQTGQPTLKLIDGSSGVNVNVSSVDGSRFNTLGSIMLASKLDQLAAQQTDPQLKDYYSQLAKYAYYIGGAEGVMDNVSEVAQGNVQTGHYDPVTGTLQTYTLGDGLRDIYAYDQKLKDLMANPPANLNTQEFQQVMPYVVDVTNIGQNYLNNFKQFIGPDGQVTQNFGDPAQCHQTRVGGCDLGIPGPGASLADASNAVAAPPGSHEMSGMSYDSLVPLDQLKINASRVLVNYDVKNTPVVATFTDARTTDSHFIR